MFESCAVYEGTQTRRLAIAPLFWFESCAVYVGAFNCPPTPTAGWTIMHFTRPRSFQVLAYLRTAQASQCLMSGAAYESTQTKKQCEKCSHCFESCAIYKGAQYGGYQQWKQNQIESCIVFKGFQSAQDNAQVCVQVLFTRPPTLIPFAPPSSSALLDTEPMIGILNIRNVSIVATWHRFFPQS